MRSCGCNPTLPALRAPCRPRFSAASPIPKTTTPGRRGLRIVNARIRSFAALAAADDRAPGPGVVDEQGPDAGPPSASRILAAACAADSALGASSSQCGGTTVDRLVWGAARLGDTEALQYLLRNGGRIGWVPLAVYSREGKLSSVDQAMGMPILCVAAMEGHLGVVQVLIQAGADVNQARTADGATPLFLAAMYKHEAIVKALIAAGADVNLAFPSDPPEQNGQGPW